MKPYMKYSEYNGTGYVEQNVAVIGYGNNAVQKCEDGTAICKKIEPYFQIDRLQWNMVDNDTLCCENKHKANILDKVHNSVSIGIAYDDYYFALYRILKIITLNLIRHLPRTIDKSTYLGTYYGMNMSLIT